MNTRRDERRLGSGHPARFHTPQTHTQNPHNPSAPLKITARIDDGEAAKSGEVLPKNRTSKTKDATPQNPCAGGFEGKSAGFCVLPFPAKRAPAFGRFLHRQALPAPPPEGSFAGSAGAFLGTCKSAPAPPALGWQMDGAERQRWHAQPPNARRRGKRRRELLRQQRAKKARQAHRQCMKRRQRQKGET